jgi:hypothetical protein
MPKRRADSLGRPPAVVDKNAILALRDAGASWRTIAEKLDIGVGTAHRIAQRRSKNLCDRFGKDGPNSDGPEVLLCLKAPKSLRSRCRVHDSSIV